MNLTKKFIFSLPAALFLAASFTACRSDLTAQTGGEITRVAIDRDTKTSRRKTSSNRKKKKTTVSVETEIDYRYTVGGKAYGGYSEKDGDVQRDFPSGGQVVVCYDPSDPAESDVFAAGHRCGS